MAIVLVLVAVVLVALVLAGACYWMRVRRRRRDAATMYVTSVPGIELEQRYGGWNADAYDAGAYHAGSYDAGAGRGLPLLGSVWHDGPPSTWGRYP